MKLTKIKMDKSIIDSFWMQWDCQRSDLFERYAKVSIFKQLNNIR